MKYVLNASVGIKWVMNEIDPSQARLFRDDCGAQIHELSAPELFTLEATRAYRGGATGNGDRRDDVVGGAVGGFAPTLPVRTIDASRQSTIPIGR
jgi:hypothetical protein